MAPSPQISSSEDSILPFGEAPVSGVRIAPEDVSDLTRRKHVRYSAEFKVRIPTMEKLEDFLSRDISVGGIFLSTERDIKKGFPGSKAATWMVS